MMDDKADIKRLQALSRLFSYPEQWPERQDLDCICPGGGRQRPDWPWPNDLTALQAAYVRLFVNALPEIPCPPYGSFYLEGTLMGESTVRLNQLYNEYGFQTSELADHIAVELEFFALLTTLTSHVEVRPDYAFLRDHLNRWTAPFFDRVQENDDTGFYAGVARFAGDFLKFYPM